MKLNKSKVQFSKSEIKLLGVTLNDKDIIPSEIKKNEALEFKVPECVSDVRRFLGLTGWFRDFIKDYARLKGSEKSWKWKEEMNYEFLNLKKILKEMGKLQIADYEKEFLLRTDASNLGMGQCCFKRITKVNGCQFNGHRRNLHLLR